YRSISEYHYKIHEVVLKQGDPITNLYIVKSGSFIFKINHESISSVSQDIWGKRNDSRSHRNGL
ncbi:MAG: hypothetical protein II431_13455, partial [Prevotella sp.]|nr:hypothetical protein [Prevotella sp.]